MRRKRNINKDFQGIKKILKIKCYVTGDIEIIASVMGMIVSTIIFSKSSRHLDHILTTDYQIQFIREGSFFISLVFACFKIQGVRTDNSTVINSYIVFKLINFVFFFTLGILLLVSFSGRGCISFILGMILISFFYIYYLGALIVLYNFNQTKILLTSALP